MRWEQLTVTAQERKKGRGRKGGVLGPGKRWGHTCNSVQGGKYIYVFGGYNKDTFQTNDVYIFDTTKKVWKKPLLKGDLPCPRDSHTCTTVGDNLFVFGGTNGKDPLQDLHILDTSTNKWTSPSLHGEKPEAREGHSAALIGKQLFIYGGAGKSQYTSDEVYYDDVYVMDTETFEWRCAITSGTPPSARDSHTCSAWKHNIVVVGGVDTSGHYLCDVNILDTDTLVWRKLDTSGQMLPPRAGHSTVVLGSNLFVFGGFTDNRNLYDDLHILDLEAGTWTKVEAVGQGPSARFSAAGDCLHAQEGVLVFIGGCNAHLEASDDMYYLHAEILKEIVQGEARPEEVSFRKELKRKCEELCDPLSLPEDNTNVCDPVSLPENNTNVLNLDKVSENVINLDTVPDKSGASSGQAGIPPTESARGVRGLKQAKLPANGGKIILSTNEYGLPNEGNADHNTFVSTIGVLSRAHIPIIYKSFREVPEEYKQKVLDILSERYEFEGIGGLGVDFVKYSMNTDWKKYKSDLHSKYVKDRDPAVVKAGPVPRGVPPKHWEMFVDYCNSPEFKALSAKFKSMREKQKGGTTLGRRSMAVVRHDMAVEKNLRFDSEVSRSDVYIKARTKKDGTLLCPAVASKLKEIESLDPESRLVGINDSLTKVVGKDSRGRMKGLGGCVSRSLVKKAKLMVKKSEAMSEEKDSIANDVLELKNGYQQLTKTVEELKAIVMATKQGESRLEPPPISHLSDDDDTQSDDSDLSLIGKHCILHGWANRVVARGVVKAIDPSLTVHGKPMGEGNFKICLTEVVDTTCLLWVPDGFNKTIDEVGVGGFIVWPRFLLEFKS